MSAAAGNTEPETQAGAGTPEQAKQSQTPTRPEWLPEKFWDATENNANLEALAKSYVSLEGKLATKSPAPPESSDKYVLKPETWDDKQPWNAEAEKTLAEVYHKAGLTQEQASAVTAHFLELEKAYAESGDGPVQQAVQRMFDEAEARRVQEHNTAVTEGIKALATEWGNDYEPRMGTIAGLALKAGLDPKDPDIFGNIKVIRMLGKVTSYLGEANQKELAGTKVVNAFASGVDEGRAIMRDPSHPDHAKFKAGDPATVQKVTKLLQQA